MSVCMCILLMLVVSPTAFPADAKWRAPRTEHGHPDLQGFWDFGTLTPFQRPAELGDRKVHTDAEVAAMERQFRDFFVRLSAKVDHSKNAPQAGDTVGQDADYSAFTQRVDLARVNGEYRTSLIVDPPNGRLPIRPGFVDYNTRRAHGVTDTDGPDSLELDTRCLHYGWAVPSMATMPWNSNMQIVQSKHHVMMATEMIHDARVVRLNGAHHGLVDWNGDSIGRWEGDTLVVHTINVRLEQSQPPLHFSEQFELTEYYTLVSPDEILYRYTVVDPLAYTQPFTAERILKRLKPGQHIYEFACHEGNYSLANILSGARKQEQEAKQSSRQ
jgi:hypothetical protein